MTEAAPTSYDLTDGLATISLDDGKANVFSNASLEALENHLDQAEADGARAMLIVGRPGRFSAGFDLAEMTSSTESMRSLVIRGARWWMRLYGMGLPTVAACTGHALAGGALTLLSCDLRIGAEVPAKIGLSEVAIGMPLPAFAVELARDRLSTTAFTASTMGAQVYDATGAAEVGYLDRVVPEPELIATATAEARRLGELSTGAYAATKQRARRAHITQTLADLEADMASVEGPTP